MARRSALFFSSTRLNCRASSPSSLAACVSGTRSARLPVVMMARAVRNIPRTGFIDRCANTAPTPRPSSSVGTMATANAIAKGRSSAAPRLVMRPTRRMAPPRRFVETSTRSLVVSRGMRRSSPGAGTRRPAVAGAFGQAREVEGRTGKHHAAGAARDQDEEAAAARRLVAVDEVVERGEAAAFVEGRAFLEARVDDRAFAALEERHHQQIQQREQHRRAQGEHPGVPQAQAQREAAPEPSSGRHVDVWVRHVCDPERSATEDKGTV